MPVALAVIRPKTMTYSNLLTVALRFYGLMLFASFILGLPQAFSLLTVPFGSADQQFNPYPHIALSLLSLGVWAALGLIIWHYSVSIAKFTLWGIGDKEVMIGTDIAGATRLAIIIVGLVTLCAAVPNLIQTVAERFIFSEELAHRMSSRGGFISPVGDFVGIVLQILLGAFLMLRSDKIMQWCHGAGRITTGASGGTTANENR